MYFIFMIRKCTLILPDGKYFKLLIKSKHALYLDLVGKCIFSKNLNCSYYCMYSN